MHEKNVRKATKSFSGFSEEVHVFHFHIHEKLLKNYFHKFKKIRMNYVKLLCEHAENGYKILKFYVDPLSANPTKWSNTLKQFVNNSQRVV